MIFRDWYKSYVRKIMEKAELHYYGQTPYKAVRVLCSDGIRRTAHIPATTRTELPLRAHVNVTARLEAQPKRRSFPVTGFLKAEGEDIIFLAHPMGKNAFLLP